VTKKSRAHSADEFGKTDASSSIPSRIGDMGAPSRILLDARVERESGITLQPSTVSTRTLVIILVALFVLGLAIVFGYVLVTGHMPVSTAI
jgi:hypothetical protein